MKYVYILTSTEKDYYCEQCLISMTSLLKYNPSVKIVLLTDNLTYKTLTGFRSKILHLASEVVIKKFADSVTQQVRSRLLKTSMRKLVKGGFIFLDLDTVIADFIDMTGDESIDIAMVLDKHLQISEHYMYKYLRTNANRMGYSIGYENKHFNSGVIYVNDTLTAYRFFDLWHDLYQETLKRGIHIDQTSLNEANVRMKGIIKELDGSWNVQINCGLKFLSKAKVIHYLGYQPLNKQNIYYNTLPFELCSEKYFKEIKKKQEITAEVTDIINDPKAAFKAVAIIPEDCVAYTLLWSNHMRVLKFLYVKCHFIYKIFEYVFGELFFRIFRRV